MNCNRTTSFFLLFLYSLMLYSGCASSQFRNIDVYVRQQDWQKAMTALKEVTQKNPRNGEAHLQLAEVYAELGMISQMTASLKTARSISRIYLEPADFIRNKYWIENFKQGNIRYDERLFNEATLHFQRAVQIDSSKVLGLKRYADALFKIVRYRESEKIYHFVLTKEPNYLPAQNNLAEIYFMQKKYRKSIEFCDKVLSRNEKDAQALTRRAYAFDAMDDFADAEKSYLRAIAAEPGARILTDFGLLYFRHEKYQAAIANFNQALSISDSNILVYRHLGEANWRIRNYTEMAKWYEKIIKAYPDDLQVWKNLAVAYEALGHKKQLAEARHFINRIASAN